MDGIGPTRGWETYWMEVDVARRRGAPWAARRETNLRHRDAAVGRRVIILRQNLSEKCVEFRRAPRPVVREQKDAAVRLRRIVEEQGLEVNPAVVSGSARHPARQDAVAGEPALPRKRCTSPRTMFGQDTFAQDGVSGVYRRGGFVFRRCRAPPTS